MLEVDLYICQRQSLDARCRSGRREYGGWRDDGDNLDGQPSGDGSIQRQECRADPSLAPTSIGDREPRAIFEP